MRIGGIYKIQSVIKPERFYIGSAVYIKGRWSSHLNDLRKTKHHSPKLQYHFNKYGESDLVFITVEVCLKEFLISREQYYIDTLNPWFNIYKIAGSSAGHKQTEEHKKKLSIAHTGKKLPEEQKIKIGLASKGNKYRLGQTSSEETRKKISESNTGRVVSKETRNKISITHLGRSKSEDARKKMLGNKNGLGNKAHSGEVHTQEYKDKMRESVTKAWAIRKLKQKIA